MIVLLRFVGVMNAAVWLGAAVFFFLGVTPATFSPEMKQLLTDRLFPSYSAIMDGIYWDRFLAFQIWCAVIALVHQLAEWLYLGRRLERLTMWLVIVLLGLGLVDGFWVQPHLERLHEIKFAYRKTVKGYESHPVYTDEQRAKAAKSLRFWEGVSRIGTLGINTGKISLTMNWLALGCLGLLAWRVANPVDVPRFIPASKFRG